jgi:hypothetical protein
METDSWPDEAILEKKRTRKGSVEWFSKKLKLGQRNYYRTVCRVLPARVSKAWLDRLFSSSVMAQRPVIPFVVADELLGADLDLDVNPQNVKTRIWKYHTIGENKYLTGDWFSLQGSWHLTPVEEHWTYRTMRELMHSSGNFTGINSYSSAQQRLAKHGPYFHNGRYVETSEDINSYFVKYKRLIESISCDGFAYDHSKNREAERIGIAIDQTGNLVHFQKGNHRFAILREMGFESIPVRLRLLHNDWLKDNWQASVGSQEKLVQSIRRQCRTKLK